MVKINAIDLFCGVGGLTHGLIRSGINVLAGVDVDPECKWAYEKNNNASYIHSDIAVVSGNDLKRIWPTDGIKLLAGCAPCQPFSSYQKGRKKIQNNKWKLLKEFGRLVKESAPDLVTMENVPQLRNHEVFLEFKKNLKKEGYSIWCGIVNCQEYGIPQKRQRLVLLASKLGLIEINKPIYPKSIMTVRDAIGHLPPISDGETYQKDRLHSSARLSLLNRQRIMQSIPGGTWMDWEPHLIAACHQKETGKTYTSVYGRMRWDEPAPTMTTLCFGYGNGRFGHPSQNRAISLREAAIFQGFPENYEFLPSDEKIKFNTLGRLIGNAVPVKLGEIVGETFILHTQNM